MNKTIERSSQTVIYLVNRIVLMVKQDTNLNKKDT